MSRRTSAGPATHARAVSRASGATLRKESSERCPDAAPALGEEAGARGCAGAAEADEDLEEHVVQELADCWT